MRCVCIQTTTVLAANEDLGMVGAQRRLYIANGITHDVKYAETFGKSAR